MDLNYIHVYLNMFWMNYCIDWNYWLHGWWLTRPLIKLTSHYSKLNVSIMKLNDDKFIYDFSFSFNRRKPEE